MENTKENIFIDIGLKGLKHTKAFQPRNQYYK